MELDFSVEIQRNRLHSFSLFPKHNIIRERFEIDKISIWP